MKKIFYLAIAAAAIMSCSKTEPVYTQPEEISFMPVSRIESKAAVTGIYYTADQNFYVFANTVAETTQKYFENIEFSKLTTSGSVVTVDNPNSEDNADILTVFVGNPTQYWPNVTPLQFFGVTKSGNVNDPITPAIDADFTTMTLTGYEQPSPTVEASNDLMYFYDNNNGAGYTKGTQQVIPVMKHACSWLTFNMQADAALTTYWKDLKVTAVKLLNLKD